MSVKVFSLLLTILMVFSLASCAPKAPMTSDSQAAANDAASDSSDSSEPTIANDVGANVPADDSDDVTDEVTAVIQGDIVPSYTVDWPSEMLPSDFPNLGKVTKIYDSRKFGNKVTINWNILSEKEALELADKLNEYLDYDHAWQGSFFSDGIKYKPGTEDDFIRIVIRYFPSATGALEPEFDPQFYIDISGEGLVEKD